MIAILQTPDTNSESQRLADNLLPRAAEVFRAHEQRIHRRGQMQQLIDLYLVETAPMLDGLGEAFTRPLRELKQLGPAGDLSGAHALLADVRPKFPRVQSAFTQPVQTLPTSNS